MASALNWTAVEAHQRPGNYWHMLPTGEQSRKAIWNAIDAQTGKRRIDQALPVELRSATRDSDMWIKFKFGSSWQIVARWSAPPRSASRSQDGLWWTRWRWAYLSPILEANGGWAPFITTLRGRNHATQFIGDTLSARRSPRCSPGILPFRGVAVDLGGPAQALSGGGLSPWLLTRPKRHPGGIIVPGKKLAARGRADQLDVAFEWARSGIETLA